MFNPRKKTEKLGDFFFLTAKESSRDGIMIQ